MKTYASEATITHWSAFREAIAARLSRPDPDEEPERQVLLEMRQAAEMAIAQRARSSLVDAITRAARAKHQRRLAAIEQFIVQRVGRISLVSVLKIFSSFTHNLYGRLTATAQKYRSSLSVGIVAIVLVCLSAGACFNGAAVWGRFSKNAVDCANVENFRSLLLSQALETERSFNTAVFSPRTQTVPSSALITSKIYLVASADSALPAVEVSDSRVDFHQCGAQIYSLGKKAADNRYIQIILSRVAALSQQCNRLATGCRSYCASVDLIVREVMSDAVPSRKVMAPKHWVSALSMQAMLPRDVSIHGAN